jgi:alcohol dehydrogenase class IV
MDALVQAVESFVSNGASAVTDAWALDAVSMIGRHIEGFMGHPDGSDAEAMLVGSYLAGLALSNARLGLVHGLAHPLGARYGAAHGVVCAVCFPHVMRFNLAAVGGKYDAICRALDGDAIETVRRLCVRLGIRSPFSGAALRDEDGIVRETLASGSTKANPRPVSAADVNVLLAAIFAA